MSYRKDSDDCVKSGIEGKRKAYNNVRITDCRKLNNFWARGAFLPITENILLIQVVKIFLNVYLNQMITCFTSSYMENILWHHKCNEVINNKCKQWNNSSIHIHIFWKIFWNYFDFMIVLNKKLFKHCLKLRASLKV